MNRIVRALGCLAGALAMGVPGLAAAALHVVIVEGLGGEHTYTEQFDAEVQALRTASASLTSDAEIRLFQGEAAHRTAVLDYFKTLAGELKSDDRVLVYLVGHGSFDGQEYKFNIPGPDLSGHDIARMLDALPAQQQAVVATGSSSGALQELLKKPARVVITATRSGNEKNATRFGEEFVAAFTDPAADTDKSGSVSAKEAFDFAARRVQDYFERQTQLATEHPTLEGERAARFTLAQVAGDGGSETAAAAASPASSELAGERDALNARIEELRLRKDQMAEAEYTGQLEQLLLQLAQLQERIDAGAKADAPAQVPAPLPAQAAP
jgi:hypothetical protein